MAHWIIENWNGSSVTKKSVIAALMAGAIGMPLYILKHNTTRERPLLENTSAEHSAEEQKLAPIYDDKTGQYAVEFSPNENQAIPLEDKIAFENKTTVSMFNELVGNLQRDYKQELNGRKFTKYEILQIAQKVNDPNYSQNLDIISENEAKNAKNLYKADGRKAFPIEFEEVTKPKMAAEEPASNGVAYDKLERSVTEYWEASKLKMNVHQEGWRRERDAAEQDYNRRMNADTDFRKMQAAWNYRKQHR